MKITVEANVELFSAANCPMSIARPLGLVHIVLPETVDSQSFIADWMQMENFRISIGTSRETVKFFTTYSMGFTSPPPKPEIKVRRQRRKPTGAPPAQPAATTTAPTAGPSAESASQQGSP